MTGASALAGLDADTGVVGVHAGYNRDLGDWVVGAEVDYDRVDANLSRGGAGGEELDSIARLKLRAGYDLGPTLLYATAGSARAETS